MIEKIGIVFKTILIVYTAVISIANASGADTHDVATVSDDAGVGRFDIVQPVEEIETPPIVVNSLGEFKITAYCACEKCCGVWAQNRPIDEFGNQIVRGCAGDILKGDYSVAVDFNVIPYGSNIVIDGKVYKAQDCGGAIKGNRIDIYLPCHQSALDFGIQYKTVYIVRSNYESID